MRVRATLAAALLVATAALPAAQPPALGPGERVTDGVLLYRFDDPSLLTPAGPIAVQALRLDPRKVRLESGLAEDRVPARETVHQIAARRGAIAAVNAGFFSLADGDPVSLLKAHGELVSDTDRPRGAVAMLDEHGATRLLFDRVTVAVRVAIHGRRLPVNAIDAAPATGKLTLYTPTYQGQVLPADGGTEWLLESGAHPRVTARYPSSGAATTHGQTTVLSLGSGTPLPPLDLLAPPNKIGIETSYRTRLGSAATDWSRAATVVSGAGLLVLDGRELTDWKEDGLSRAFDTTRHPRTLIGVDAGGGDLARHDRRPQPRAEPGHDLRRVTGALAASRAAIGAEPGRRRIRDDGRAREDREPSVRRDRSPASQRRDPCAAAAEMRRSADFAGVRAGSARMNPSEVAEPRDSLSWRTRSCRHSS
jgi:hypothetical protein